MSVTTQFTSPIFDRSKRNQAFGSFVRKQGRDFVVLTKQRMDEGPQTGRLYRKKRGTNFRRSHRASARGQRPAVDTGTLKNSVAMTPTGDLSVKVHIKDRINPQSGTSETKIAEILQNKLDRPIMNFADAAEAQAKMKREGEALVRTLL